MYSTSIPHVQLKKYADKSKNVVKTEIRISRKSILLENALASKLKLKIKMKLHLI